MQNQPRQLRALRERRAQLRHAMSAPPPMLLKIDPPSLPPDVREHDLGIGEIGELGNARERERGRIKFPGNFPAAQFTACQKG